MRHLRASWSGPHAPALSRGMGPDGVLMIEGSGDVTGRWVDRHGAYPNDPSIAYTLPARRYCEVRQLLRDDGAPGYPQTYRYTTGLEVGDDAIEAAAFVETKGVTVVLFATSDVRSEIHVDGKAVGHPGIGRQPHLADMNEGELDFWVLTV